MFDCLFKLWGRIVKAGSWEWLLEGERTNGGDLILLRSFLICTQFYLLFLFIYNVTAPNMAWVFSHEKLRHDLLLSYKIYAAMFAAVYTALYARFSSQWTYLSNLYNQIKQAEIRMKHAQYSWEHTENTDDLAAWKAGFIEDAHELHLISKPIFASVIQAWLRDDLVRRAFIKYTPGSDRRLEFIEATVQRVCSKAGKFWENRK